MKPLWSPPAARIAAAHLSHFAAAQGFTPPPRADADAYRRLWRWSVQQPVAFWQALWDYAGVQAHAAPQAVLRQADAMPGAEWFPGATLNYAEHLLRPAGAPEPAALIACDERGQRQEVSRAGLRLQVAALAAALREDGVQPGDRVAGFLPNGVDAIVAMLATASLGAVWSSCSPDFGEAGVLERFGQIAPKVLIACDGYHYNGKRIDTLPRVLRVARALPALRRLVIVPVIDSASDDPGVADAIRIGDYLRPGESLTFTPVPFNHPLFVMYSSGTTGKPKCIVHGHGGALLQHFKEHLLHGDIRRGDRLFFFTTCGWMMWNWLASALAVGATLVLYDGSPTWPDIGALWRLAEREQLTQFGTSPKYLAALEKSGYGVGAHDLAALRTVFSTGSPLAPAQFEYVYQAVKPDVQLASISGGTDLIACFALGNPWSPVWPGELQGAGLGMAVDIFDEDGQPLRGAAGELVCTQPFPSIPVAFWNDADGSRFRAAYFERFPGVWHHGDYAEATEHGGYRFQGRSDATLNPGGVRIGTAEIYRVVDALPEVLESVVVSHRRDGDERVVLFVRLRDGVDWSASLERTIRDAVRRELTPRHVPAVIKPCPEVPRTISGKITELAVRDLLHGRPVKNAEALANPDALEFFARSAREI